MFDTYVLAEGSCENVVKNEKTIGFQMKSLIPYYRGIPCSMVHLVEVLVDGQKIQQDAIMFSPDGEDFFTLDELTTVSSYKWEYGDKAVIFVEKEGGLAAGEHDVTLRLAVRVAYIPVPFVGQRTEKVSISK